MSQETRVKTVKQTATETKVDDQHKQRTELKNLKTELAEARSTINRLSVKNDRLRQRVTASRTQELALRQYNRMLLTMVSSYMDREATLLANTRTVMQAYPNNVHSEPIQETIHEVFDI